jgi:hypothetical protein
MSSSAQMKQTMNFFDRILTLLIGRPVNKVPEYVLPTMPRKKSVRIDEAKNQIFLLKETEQMVGAIDRFIQENNDDYRKRQQFIRLHHRYIQKQSPPPSAGTILRAISKSGKICIAIVQRDGSLLEFQRGHQFEHGIYNRFIFSDLREWNYFVSRL